MQRFSRRLIQSTNGDSSVSWCIRSVAKWSQDWPKKNSIRKLRLRYSLSSKISCLCRHSGNSLLKFCLDFLVFSAKSIQIVCPDRFNQSLFSSSAIYPKYFPAFTFLVNNSSERSENTSQSSKAPTKTFARKPLLPLGPSSLSLSFSRRLLALPSPQALLIYTKFPANRPSLILQLFASSFRK